MCLPKFYSRYGACVSPPLGFGAGHKLRGGGSAKWCGNIQSKLELAHHHSHHHQHDHNNNDEQQ